MMDLSDGLVVGVELEPHLVEFGAANLAKYDYPCATIRQSPPDVLGAPDEAPFDRILVSAEAPTLPPALVAQLGVGGVLVEDVTVSTHGLYSFVPLR